MKNGSVPRLDLIGNDVGLPLRLALELSSGRLEQVACLEGLKERPIVIQSAGLKTALSTSLEGRPNLQP